MLAMSFDPKRKTCRSLVSNKRGAQTCFAMLAMSFDTSFFSSISTELDLPPISFVPSDMGSYFSSSAYGWRVEEAGVGGRC